METIINIVIDFFGDAIDLLTDFLLLRWISRSRQNAEVTSDEILRYPRSYLWVGIGSMAGPLLMIAVMLTATIIRHERFDKQFMEGTAAFLFLAFCALWMVLTYYREYFEVTPDGFIYKGLFRNGILRWQDITEIQYSFAYFCLKTNDGKRILISLTLANLPIFARAILQHTPQAKRDRETDAILRSTAEGVLPSVLGRLGI